MNSEQNHGGGAGIKPGRPVDPASRTPILTVERLKKYYPVKGGVITHKIGDVRAVDGVSFTVYQGETLGLVASPAAASPPWGGRSWPWSGPPPERSSIVAWTWPP